MIIVREIGATEYPNHLYILSDDKTKMYGYVMAGTGQKKAFSRPHSFDARGRKFEIIQRKTRTKKEAA